MATFPSRVADRLFDHLPTPVLALLCVVTAFAFGVDLLVPDILPLVDEAFLLVVLGGAGSALLERRRRRSTALDPLAPLTPRGRRTRGELEQAGGALRRQAEGRMGLSNPAVALLVEAEAEVRALRRTLDTADRELARSASDPWLLRVRLDRAEHAAAGEEDGSDRRRKDRRLTEVRSLRSELDVAERRVEARDDAWVRWTTLEAEQEQLAAILAGQPGRSRLGDSGRAVLFRQRVAEWIAAEAEVANLRGLKA